MGTRQRRARERIHVCAMDIGMEGLVSGEHQRRAVGVEVEVEVESVVLWCGVVLCSVVWCLWLSSGTQRDVDGALQSTEPVVRCDVTST
jgi:hypothetical protein